MTGADAVHPSAWVFAGIVLTGAVLAVSLRNILHAIFGFALTVLGLAGLFVFLGSPFVAAMQVLIYAGGISVAMVFAIMFSYTLGVPGRAGGPRVPPIVPAAAFFAALAILIRRGSFSIAPTDRDWSLESIGRALLNHYNVVFEGLSVVLLLAIAGAILIARKEPRT